MSAAKTLGRVFRENFGMHLAWLPLTSSLSLGDYGVWRGGVFAPLGNVAEFGVSICRQHGDETSLDFISAGAASVGLNAAERSGLKRLGGRAEVCLRFDRADACVVRVGRLTSERITNVARLARDLSEQRGWRTRYKVITELFTGEDVLLLVASEKGTEIELRGKLCGGLRSADAGIEVKASKRLGLEINGGGGPIGLKVCRIRISGTPALAFSDLEDLGKGTELSELIEEGMREEPLDDSSESA